MIETVKYKDSLKFLVQRLASFVSVDSTKGTVSQGKPSVYMDDDLNINQSFKPAYLWWWRGNPEGVNLIVSSVILLGHPSVLGLYVNRGRCKYL